MTDRALRPTMLRADPVLRRRQARRFWGAMGAAIRETSRWLDERSHAEADPSICATHIRFRARPDVGMRATAGV
jgi:hypothetical protein